MKQEKRTSLTSDIIHERGDFAFQMRNQNMKKQLAWFRIEEKSYKQKATALCRMLRRMVGNNSNPLLLSPPLCHSPHRIVCWKALTRYSLRSVHRVALNHLSYCWQEWNRWERSDCPKLCIDSWHISVIEQTDLLIFAIPLLEEAKWSPGSFGTRSQDHRLSNGHSKLTN